MLNTDKESQKSQILVLEKIISLYSAVYPVITRQIVHLTMYRHHASLTAWEVILFPKVFII